MTKKNQDARNALAAKKLKERIALQLKRGAGKGLEAAIRFLAARIKETVSVPAPKKPIRGVPLPGKRLGPILGYRATAPAIKGAPPRVLSGRLRQGVTSKMLTPHIGLVGTHARSLPSKKYPGGFSYPKKHELGNTNELGEGDHPFILPTFERYRKELRVIVGTEVSMELKTR